MIIEHAEDCPANRAVSNSHSPCRGGNCPVSIAKALRGLLSVAKIAMPGTYFRTDTRVRLAKDTLEALKTTPKGRRE